MLEALFAGHFRHNPRQCACRGRAADHSADIGSSQLSHTATTLPESGTATRQVAGRPEAAVADPNFPRSHAGLGVNVARMMTDNGSCYRAFDCRHRRPMRRELAQ